MGTALLLSLSIIECRDQKPGYPDQGGLFLHGLAFAEIQEGMTPFFRHKNPNYFSGLSGQQELYRQRTMLLKQRG